MKLSLADCLKVPALSLPDGCLSLSGMVFMGVRAGEMFSLNVAMVRADGKSRADRKIGQMEIFRDPLDHQPGTAPVVEAFSQETVEDGAARILGLQRVLMGQGLEDIRRRIDRQMGRVGV